MTRGAHLGQCCKGREEPRVVLHVDGESRYRSGGGARHKDRGWCRSESNGLIAECRHWRCCWISLGPRGTGVCSNTHAEACQSNHLQMGARPCMPQPCIPPAVQKWHPADTHAMGAAHLRRTPQSKQGVPMLGCMLNVILYTAKMKVQCHKLQCK